MDTEYYTPREIAERLRVDYRTVTKWIKTGVLEAETLHEGKRVRHHIPKAEIDRIEQLGKHQQLV